MILIEKTNDVKHIDKKKKKDWESIKYRDWVNKPLLDDQFDQQIYI